MDEPQVVEKTFLCGIEDDNKTIAEGSVRPGLTYMCPHGAISLAP